MKKNLYFNFHVYTCNPETGEGGWFIKFVCVKANDKAEAKERLKLFPHFDEIILFDFQTPYEENCDFFEIKGWRSDEIISRITL